MIENQIRDLAKGVVEKLDGKTVDMVKVLVDFGAIVLDKFSAKFMVLKLEGGVWNLYMSSFITGYYVFF